MDIVVIGGGITGLAAAYALRRRAADAPPAVTLVEAAPRWGGKIHTLHTEGFVIEAGPDAFLVQKPWALALCRELGLESRLIGVRPEHRRFYLVRNGRLVPVPEGLFLVVPTRLRPLVTSPLFSWKGKVRMGLEVFVPPRRQVDDESVGQFVRRRLGSEALERLAGPLLGGIHAADPDRLSLLATFPRLAELERCHGSLIRGVLARRRTASSGRGQGGGSPFMTLKGGLGELVEALVGVLRKQGCALLPGCRVRAVRREAGRYAVVLEDGRLLMADAVIATTPPRATAELVAGLAPDLAALLQRFEATSSAVISLAFREDELPDLPAGSGFLVPRGEGLSLTGCTWSSNKFEGRAPPGHVLWRAFVGGEGREADAHRPDEHLVEAVCRELAALLGVRAEPRLALVHRWLDARPLYHVGHLERVARVEAACPPGFFVAGSAYRGAGLPDCIRSGFDAAERALALQVQPSQEVA